MAAELYSANCEQEAVLASTACKFSYNKQNCMQKTVKRQLQGDNWHALLVVHEREKKENTSHHG